LNEEVFMAQAASGPP